MYSPNPPNDVRGLESEMAFCIGFATALHNTTMPRKRSARTAETEEKVEQATEASKFKKAKSAYAAGWRNPRCREMTPHSPARQSLLVNSRCRAPNQYCLVLCRIDVLLRKRLDPSYCISVYPFSFANTSNSITGEVISLLYSTSLALALYCPEPSLLKFIKKQCSLRSHCFLMNFRCFGLYRMQECHFLNSLAKVTRQGVLAKVARWVHTSGISRVTGTRL
jgi:hypothetical protein